MKVQRLNPVQSRFIVEITGRARHWKNGWAVEIETGVGYKLGESTENNKALLILSGKETIQTFNGSVYTIMLLFAKWSACELPCLKIL